MNNKEPFELQEMDNQTGMITQCSLCTKKDAEDCYIVFNLLYRIITGHVFHQTSKGDELNYDLDIPPYVEEEKDASVPKEDERSDEEKLRHFKERVSAKLLREMIACPEFDQLLKEIFKTKYEPIMPSCRHLELARDLTTALDIQEEEQKRASEDLSLSEKEPDYVNRIKTLVSAIKKFKNDMEVYHSEINGLTNHIVSKLFDNHSHLIKKDNYEELKGDFHADDEEDSMDMTEELHDSQRMKEELEFKNKDFNSNYSSSFKLSTVASSHASNSISGNGNGHGTSLISERSMDFTSNGPVPEEELKKTSRYASFKSKLPKKATDVLKSWFLNNIQNPYPSHEAKEVLSKMTGLSKKQIQNWFTNSRKRFLEPLKKKMDTIKQKSDTNPDATSQNDGYSSTPKAQMTDSQHNVMNLETQSQPIPQQLQKENNFQAYNQMPILTTQKDSSQIPIMNQQRIAPSHMTGPAMIYQGYIPNGQMNPAGASIVILNPYMMAQPSMVYPYRPTVANVVPINASFVPLSQGNITIMNQSNMVGGPYIVPIQPMNIRSVMGQNLSTSFNTINNNVFTNINNMGGMVPEMMADGNSPKLLYGEMPSNSNEVVNQESLITGTGKSRSKAELEGLYTTTKHLHKDDGKDQV